MKTKCGFLGISGSFLIVLTATFGWGQDAVQVAPDQFKVLDENPRLRVVESNVPAGAKTAMHSHPDMVVVLLEGGAGKWTRPDGTVEMTPASLKRGAALYRAAESHAFENLGNVAAHSILVEFKGSPQTAGKAREPVLPAPFVQVADGAFARVFTLSVPPGGKVGEHTHGDHVLVALSDGVAEATDHAGKKTTMQFKKDTAVIGGPTTHSAVNTGTTQIELVEIELK
jgi:quercetin dioxygenase-like cupin family protein